MKRLLLLPALVLAAVSSGRAEGLALTAPFSEPTSAVFLLGAGLMLVMAQRKRR